MLIDSVSRVEELAVLFFFCFVFPYPALSRFDSELRCTSAYVQVECIFGACLQGVL